MSKTTPKRKDSSTCIIGEADPFLARLLERFAQKSGLRPRRAQTGEDVLALARRETPALIVLDPELPGKTRGWEAVQALGESSETAAVPVILCAWLEESEAQALAGRCLPYLQKPDLHYEDFSAALTGSGKNQAMIGGA